MSLEDIEFKNDLDILFKAILELQTIEECYKFFEDITTINELYLANNNLTELNMSNLAIYNSVRPKVDLSNNQISSINNFVYPSSGLAKFDLSFNKPKVLSRAKTPKPIINTKDKYCVATHAPLANFIQPAAATF